MKIPTSTLSLALLACAVLGFGACGGGNEPVKPGAPKFSLDAQPGDSDAMKVAKERFKMACSACHGLTGVGDGAAAVALPVKPRNYTDKAWQASTTDEQIAKVILEGGAAVGKSPLMAANPDLADKKDVVDSLVKIIRAFGQ